MKRNTLVLSILICCCTSWTWAQSSIKYMSYNLLDYGEPYTFCTPANNNLTLKNQYLRSIFSWVQPDIFAACEIIPVGSNTVMILDSVINAAGPRVFAKAGFTNYSGGDMVNMIYYDPQKLALKSQDVVITDIRDINIYHFYLKTKDLGMSPDTIFMTAIIAHLKAGSTGADEQKRSTMTLNLMNYLNIQGLSGNMLVSGDFNFYTSAEQGYQNLLNYVNPALRFNDPINRPGGWNSDPSFADIHTQSTRSASTGCGASGGLDDRFDFILASNSVMTGTLGLQYITDTYRAIGQDGNHYNLSLNSPPENTAAPAEVINALYSMSDHLPVVMEMLTSSPLQGIETTIETFGISITSPAHGQARVFFGQSPGILKMEVLDMQGRVVLPERIVPEFASHADIDLTGMNPGLYLVRFTDKKGNSSLRKLVVY